MKKYAIIIILTALIFSNYSCTDDFEEIDRSKTGSDLIDPNPLFTRSLVTGSGISVAVWQLVNQTSGSVYAQHWANIVGGFTSDNYEPGPGNTVWEWYYAREHFAPLHFNYHVQKLLSDINNPVKMAISQIWGVYMYQLLTDSYGDIPYTEAFLTVEPKFDAQKDIYLSLIDVLESSVATLNQEKGNGYETFGTADVLFQGNSEQWIKFANTLGMRIALRASNVAEAGLTIPFFNNLDETQTMQSNDDIVQVIPDPNGPTYHVKNPLSFIDTWDEVRMSELMYNLFNENNDPRMEIYAQPNIDGAYVGLRNGQVNDSLSTNYQDYKDNYCEIGTFFLGETTPHYLLTYAEACFLKAEAVVKGYMSGDANTYYDAGIKASFEQFGIMGADTLEAYLTGNAQFDAAKALEQIYTQRWIALFPNGQEAWSLVRRTGYPQILEPVYTFPGNAEMPRRVQYPLNERSYNTDNYNAAVARMGGDSQYTRLWWDGGN